MIHWEYKKFAPVKPVETQEPEKSNEQVNYYPFEISQWVKEIADVPQQSQDQQVTEQDTLESLDLNFFDRTKKTESLKNDGMSEQAIRGAVSGSSAIPGLSK